MTTVGDVESNTTVTEEVEAENSLDDGNGIESTQEGHPNTIIEASQAPAAQLEIPGELEHAPEELDYNSLDANIRFSNSIHIVGFNTHAKFLAHALASTPDVPVRLFTRYRSNLSRWGTEDRTLSLYDRQGRWISSVDIAQPLTIRDPLRHYPTRARKQQFLDNIIINAAPGAVFPSIALLLPRIDRLTTICLIQPGLGLMEDIIATYFPDPFDRPNFVLGHSTHNVGKYSDTLYSMKQYKPGTLFLYEAPKFSVSEQPALAGSPIEYEGLRLSQHLTELLSSTENLNVVRLSEQRFLLRKLPRLIFHAVADSICVILGCRYNQIRQNRDAMVMWHDLVGESISIASQLPELSSTPELVECLTAPSFRRKLQTSLFAQHHNSSPWVKQVRFGAVVPVDYFNGYLVRRAKEIGLDHKHNAMAMATVKARLSARRIELGMDLLGTTQYMGDTDTIAGAPRPGLDELDELDTE